MLNLTQNERIYVNSEIGRRGKNIVLAYILAIFFGSLGVHRFYLNQTGTAAAQLIMFLIGWALAFFIIGIPLLVAVGIWVFVDLFLIPGILAEENSKMEHKIVKEMRQTSTVS